MCSSARHAPRVVATRRSDTAARRQCAARPWALPSGHSGIVRPSTVAGLACDQSARARDDGQTVRCRVAERAARAETLRFSGRASVSASTQSQSTDSRAAPTAHGRPGHERWTLRATDIADDRFVSRVRQNPRLLLTRNPFHSIITVRFRGHAGHEANETKHV